MDIEQRRYPMGPLPRTPEPLDERVRAGHIAIIEEAPRHLRSLVDGLGKQQLEASYRPGGWTVRQLVHHIPDSHMNAYVRIKLAATEESPIVKSFEEARWAELADAKHGSIDMSLALIDGLHQRWVAFLRSLGAADLRRTFKHASWGNVTIEEMIVMYSWHCRHHAAHLAMALGKPFVNWDSRAL